MMTSRLVFGTLSYFVTTWSMRVRASSFLIRRQRSSGSSISLRSLYHRRSWWQQALREKTSSFSYDVDPDQNVEGKTKYITTSNHVASATAAQKDVSVESSHSTFPTQQQKHHHRHHRYDALLTDTGLRDEIVLQEIISHLPSRRIVSSRDIFCNRELKLSGIRAIGFDMDYTLCQYQQPVRTYENTETLERRNGQKILLKHPFCV
jgi:hypothetical protein